MLDIQLPRKQPEDYLTSSTTGGAGSGALLQQEALTITPQAAAAIATILTNFIVLFLF